MHCRHSTVSTSVEDKFYVFRAHYVVHALGWHPKLQPVWQQKLELQVVKNLQHHDAIGGSWANVEVKVAAFDRILTALNSSSLRLAARRPLCQKLNFLEPAAGDESSVRNILLILSLILLDSFFRVKSGCVETSIPGMIRTCVDRYVESSQSGWDRAV